MLADVAAVLGNREAAVAREITKAYEECVTGSLEELSARYADAPPKGEIVVIVGPPGEAEAASAEDIEAALREAMKTASPAQAAGAVARALGADRKALYARALELQGK
jgi:16S rRNA (cytidine1402-2'-O)-methyltransferase